MTKFIILTLFPEMFDTFINTSILKRAIEKKLIAIDIINIRDYAKGKNRKVDDTPYGGGSGMVMMCEPLDLSIGAALKKIDSSSKNTEIIYLSPRGKVINHEVITNFSKEVSNFILICGHYEGIDERIIKKYNIKEISIGDYVLTGGEIPAMVFVDSISRLLPGVITETSLEDESHTNILLEYPQYTKPSVYQDMQVPEVLLSGDHKKIKDYREKESIFITYKNRKDLIRKAIKSNLLDKEYLNKILKEKEVK